MRYIPITKGLNLPIAGAPAQIIEQGLSGRYLTVIGPDFFGMKPTFAVSVGDHVKKGQLLFEDKKMPGVKHTAPGAGKITEIVRGEKRAFRYLLIELDKNEESVSFKKHSAQELQNLDGEDAKKILVESGLWTAFRTRPLSRVPSPKSMPHSIFVTAMDTNPLAADPRIIIEEKAADFENGLRVLTTFCGTFVYLCKSPGWEAPGAEMPRVETAVFDGPHPAGLPGTHIHYLDPVGAKKTVWHIGYQDVIAIGELFTTGLLNTERVVAISGPRAKNPRLVRTRLGASLSELLDGEYVGEEPVRVISGSVLSGRTAISNLTPKEQWLPGLGRYHNQITLLSELHSRHFFGWMAPGFLWHSVSRTVASYLLPRFPFKMNTARYGGHRAIFPYQPFEDVMPLDLAPAHLFRSLAIGSRGLEQAESLGFLELDEEDLGLCTYIDPCKNDFGSLLKNMLALYAKE